MKALLSPTIGPDGGPASSCPGQRLLKNRRSDFRVRAAISETARKHGDGVFHLRRSARGEYLQPIKKRTQPVHLQSRNEHRLLHVYALIPAPHTPNPRTPGAIPLRLPLIHCLCKVFGRHVNTLSPCLRQAILLFSTHFCSRSAKNLLS